MKWLVLIPLAVLVILMLGEAINAATDPAIPACNQAVLEGSYTLELYGQCLDDYHEVNLP